MDAPAGSPLWWVARLTKALDVRAKQVKKSRDWYSGNHPIPEPPPNTLAAHDLEARAAFRTMAALGVMNFLAPVADVPASKLRIAGFRFGEGDRGTDNAAWTIYQRNELDADSDLVTDASMQTGQGYVLVWVDKDGLAEITVEDPAQTIVAYEAGSRRKRAAGLKRWTTDDGYQNVTLYLPDAIYKYRSLRKVDGTVDTAGLGLPQTQYGMVPQAPQFTFPMTSPGLALPASADDWVQRNVADEDWPLNNPLGVVTLVEVSGNRPLKPAPFGGGEPEFQRQIVDQERINATVLDMLLTMEHQAFRQRWVIGWKPPIDKTTGEVDKAAALKASASGLMMFGDPETKVGEFTQADFTPFLNAINAWVKGIAATSSTPPYAFLLGDMINVASDSLARIEGNLVAKLKRRSRQLGNGWTEVMRIALLVEDNALGGDTASSIVWESMEERTATEQMTVAVGMHNLGFPDEAVFAATPDIDQQEAHRLVAQKAAVALLAPPLTPTGVEPPPVAVPAP